jgi:hypothetical protein
VEIVWQVGFADASNSDNNYPHYNSDGSMNYGPSGSSHHHSISTGGGDPANSYNGGYAGLGAELGELFSYGSCDISAHTPPPPPPPTAETGLRENPGKRPVGQATGRGTTPQPGTKTAATGPSDTAPVELHGSTTTPAAYNPGTGTATMAAAEPSGGLGTVFPLDPGANDGTTLVNPLDTGAGAGLTSAFPSASDAGAGSKLINPLDPNAGTGWSSLFPVDPSAGLPTVALAQSAYVWRPGRHPNIDTEPQGPLDEDQIVRSGRASRLEPTSSCRSWMVQCWR